MAQIMSDDGSLSDALVVELQRRILTGEIPVGSWLRHEAIAKEFGVSRTPVREALRVLSAQGIVTIVQNRGARVNGHSGRDIRELGEVRAQLEGHAAELAADRIDDRQLQLMESAWHGFESAMSAFPAAAEEPAADAGKQWVDANQAFHGVIIDASGNYQLLLTINDLSRRLPRNASYSVYATNSRLMAQNVQEHRAVADAVARRDGVGAREAMTAHILSSAESMARWAEDNARLRV